MINIDDMNNLARNVGFKRTGISGKCISCEYINDKTKLKWQCGKCGYIWSASPNKVKRGSWCAKCAGNLKLTIEEMGILAKKIGKRKTGISGKCLSTIYINNRTPLEWLCCKCGNTWYAAPWNIKKGLWCRICSGITEYSITDMQKLAYDKGKDKTGKPGKCLSLTYKNVHTKLEWQCGKCGFIWKSKPNNIIQKSWCPNCSTGRKEKFCRKIFEELFKCKFPRSNPDWLINPKTSYNMHLDGFNEILKLAFEFNGIQHYKFHKFFHNNYQEFKDQRKRDLLKKQLCKEHGITLIIIPYTIKINQLRNYIIRLCKTESLLL
ncbi:MAG: hypothetical protein ACXABG_09170 [Promethearchaeota archaeon]